MEKKRRRGGGKRKLEEERAERKREVVAAAAAGVGVGLERRGGASAHAPRPERRSPRCVGPVGEGKAGSRAALGGVGWYGPLLPHTPPPPPPRRSVNPSPRRWAVLRASGFHGANYPPRARSPGLPPAAASSALLAPEGRRARAGRRDPSRPGFRNVRERSQGWF